MIALLEYYCWKNYITHFPYQSHLIGENSINTMLEQGNHPVQAVHLVLAKLAACHIFWRLGEHGFGAEWRCGISFLGELVVEQLLVLLLLGLASAARLASDFFLAGRIGCTSRGCNRLLVQQTLGLDKVGKKVGLAE